MTVFLRPDLDDTDGAWTPSAGTDLYAAIDEGQSSGSDADYIQSTPAAGVSDTCRVRLSNPGVTVAEPMTVTYRYANSGTQTGNLVVKLVQGASTVIASKTHTNVPAGTAFTTDSFTLTSLEFGTISDFDDLFVEITATGGVAVDPTLTLDLDFTAMAGTLDSRITFTRGTTGTYYNSSGAVVSASSGTPRFDYNPGTLALRGLLLEEQRTNLCLRSQELDNAAWNLTDGTRTANTTVAPDGTTTADTLTGSDLGGVGRCSLNNAAAIVTATGGQTHVMSAYVKKGSALFAMISHYNSVAGHRRVWFDLTNGTLGNQDAGSIGTIQSVGNGWYRITVVNSAPSTSDLYMFLECSRVNASVGCDPFDTVIFWGAQCELGLQATSYMPTTSSTFTRFADAGEMTSTNFSAWYNQTEGTFVADFTPIFPGSGVAGGSIVSTMGGSLNDRMDTYQYSSQYHVDIANGGTQIVSLAYGTPAANVAHSFAVAFKSNDFASCVDGGTIAPDTSGTPPTVSLLQLFARGDGASRGTGWLERLRFYNVRKTDTQMQALTT